MQVGRIAITNQCQENAANYLDKRAKKVVFFENEKGLTAKNGKEMSFALCADYQAFIKMETCKKGIIPCQSSALRLQKGCFDPLIVAL